MNPGRPSSSSSGGAARRPTKASKGAPRVRRLALALLACVVGGLALSQGAAAQSSGTVNPGPVGITRASPYPLRVVGRTVTMHQADASHSGWLSSADFATFSGGGGGGSGSAGGFLAYAEYTLETNLQPATNWIPDDGSNWDNTEGNDVPGLHVAFAATSATQSITIQASVSAQSPDVTDLICGIFREDTANVLFANAVTLNANYAASVPLTGKYTPGDTSSHTYRVRCGGNVINASTRIYANALYKATAPAFTLQPYLKSWVGIVGGSGSSGGGGSSCAGCVDTATAPLSISGTTISIPAATDSVDGYLTHADHATFNAKAAGHTCESVTSVAFGSIGAGDFATSTATCTGASTGNACSASQVSANLGAGILVVAGVSAANTVRMIASCSHGANPCNATTYSVRVVCDP